MEQREPVQLSDIERERMILRQGIEQDSRTLRVAGFVAMGLGLTLVLIIGVVAYYTVPIMLADGETVDGSRFTGGFEVRLVIFALYAAVAAIGITAMLGGAVHVTTGRRFAPAVRLMTFLASILVLLGIAVRWLA